MTIMEVTSLGEDGSPPLLAPGPTAAAIRHKCTELIIEHDIRDIGVMPVASKILGYQKQELDRRSKEIKSDILYDRIKSTPELNSTLFSEASIKWYIKRNFNDLTSDEQEIFDEVVLVYISKCIVYVYYMCRYIL